MGRQRRKHIPQRTCVGCRKKKDKRQLTRIVRTPSDGIIIDLSGKHNGRGAYLCDDAKCWELAINTPLLDKALRTTMSTIEKENLKHHLYSINEASAPDSITISD